MVMKLAPRARVVGDERGALIAEIVEEYERGTSIRDIARIRGRSYGNIHKLLVEAGVELRSRGGNQLGPDRPARKPAKLSPDEMREYRERLQETRPGRKR